MYSSRRLVWKQERFRIRSLSANFKGSEIFTPFPVRDFGIGFHPQPQFIQVLYRDAPIRHPLYQVFAQLIRKVCPSFQLWHLSAEDDLPELLPEAFRLFRIVGGAKTFGEFKEVLFLLFFRFERLFNKFNQHPVGA